MNKHTPGPWKSFASQTHNYGTNPDGDRYGEFLIIRADDEGTQLGRNVIARTDMSESDSRLIACAPEMLEALKAVFKLPVSPDGQILSKEDLARVQAIIRTVIAKAEGAS